MKLYKIIIDKKADKDNETRFNNVMETFMGEYPVDELANFTEWTTKEHILLGEWAMQKVNNRRRSFETLFVEDNDGNITEYFVQMKNGAIRHRTVQF